MMCDHCTNQPPISHSLAYSLAHCHPQATDPVLKVLNEDCSEHALALAAVEMFTFVHTPKDKADPGDVGVMFTEMFVNVRCSCFFGQNLLCCSRRLLLDQTPAPALFEASMDVCNPTEPCLSDGAVLVQFSDSCHPSTPSQLLKVNKQTDNIKTLIKVGVFVEAPCLCGGSFVPLTLGSRLSQRSMCVLMLQSALKHLHHTSRGATTLNWLLTFPNLPL
jgi:hypothetical protein